MIQAIILYVAIGMNLVFSLLAALRILKWERRRQALELAYQEVVAELKVNNTRLMQEFFADPYNPKWYDSSLNNSPRLH